MAVPPQRRPRYQPQPWDPETGYYPEKGVNVKTIYERSWRNRHKPVEVPDFQDESFGFPNFPEISVHWLEVWGENPNYDGKKDLMLATEAICRAEAARLDLNAVVIRTGLHNKKDQHAVDGTVLTYEDPRTGYIKNDTANADWHFTVEVYMGYDEENVIIQGHIYVAFDSKAPQGLRIMNNPSVEKKHVDTGKGYVASEFWTVT
ncbi:hypothetical protein GE21DRAFT_3864 [Neurospora crassa]|uniref:Uncharacterized protein n=1 Tax=Neurospora crassa (strain ATCC 24698 / 74-OR23-1A / CBS 708.71 / DSM 1257 / FGSC 987) TaxID=367110 RepID=Q7SAX3_NEUCR|nr:hypothetical protein NCU05661 [Neurospora crassa OR74A]EAA33530.1 hypothetical protein NCU05661 [Neurospora crassa OR74A]KHE83806.1 hypothetical protein GE21DRAFT_3864 [Neurospora crassa]|eukprot:XP_962766.1 hypothetical protein NCU05661 [Neurospora crassa OR74A]